MKKLLLTLIVSLACCGSIFAQYESHWPDFYYPAFQFQTGFVAAIELDGEIVTADHPGWDALEVAFFVGDECRGAGVAFGDYTPSVNYLYNGYVEEYGDPFPVIDGAPVYYDNANEEVTVRMYDHLNGIEYNECIVTLLGEPYVILTGGANDQGWFDPENPIILHFTTPAPSSITKDIAPGQWYLISSPVVEAPITDVENLVSSEAFGLYSFDQTQDLEWINYIAEGGGVNPDFESILISGKGYLYYNETEVTLTFPGNAYEAEGAFDLVYDETADFPGVNLVGNPFNAEATVDRPFYVINEANNGVMLGSDVVPAMEGCFVVASTPEQEPEPKVTFTPVTGWVGGDVEPGEGELKLNLSCNSKVIDRAIVGFGQGNTLPKFQFRNSSKVCIPVDGKDYAIVRSEGMGELPVSFKANENGTYSLSLSSENTEFSYLHLVDNLTGADQDMLANPSYSFEARTTDYASRFRLVFATANDEDSFAFFSNGSLIINNEGNATLQVVDVTGRIVKCESINGCASVSVDGASGVYMVRLVNGDNVKVQKVVK